MEALCQFSHGISQQPKVMADSENFKCCIAGFLRYINICGVGRKLRHNFAKVVQVGELPTHRSKFSIIKVAKLN